MLYYLPDELKQKNWNKYSDIYLLCYIFLKITLRSILKISPSFVNLVFCSTVL